MGISCGRQITDKRMQMGIDPLSDSATSLGGAPQADREGLVDHYVTPVLQQLTRQPYSSAPGMMRMLPRAGPFTDKQEIPEVCRGRGNSPATIRRMNAVRRAALEGSLDSLPAATRPEEGEEMSLAIPAIDQLVENWPPWIMGAGIPTSSGSHLRC